MGLVRAGDATMIIKYVTKMTAHGHGQTATFMPKPLYGEAGSGMHFHQHLFKKGKNFFYDAAGYGCLSQEALYYIEGLLLHGPALLALTNPSTNSYCRLILGFEAPFNAFFSLGNRSAAVRIPKYANQPDSARMEFHPPDASCNVYQALAGMLLAGLVESAKKLIRRFQVLVQLTKIFSRGRMSSVQKSRPRHPPLMKPCVHWRLTINYLHRTGYLLTNSSPNGLSSNAIRNLCGSQSTSSL